MSGSDSLVVTTHSPQETESFGERLASRLKPGDVIALIGDLGAGKTCLTRGIARGLGSRDRVSSPTFVLIHRYAAPIPLYHLDLYRLAGEAELEDIGGIDLMYEDGVCVIEWAERATDALPPHTLTIRLDTISESTRRLTLSGERSESLPHWGKASGLSR